MSNIYCWLNTDNAKEVTRTASYELNFKVNVGSKALSKEIIKIKVGKTRTGFEVFVDNKKHKEIKSDL